MRLRSHTVCLPAVLILYLGIIATLSAKVSARPVFDQSVRIDKIVINGQVVSNPNVSQVKVVRASDNTEVPGEIGLSLYANDRVTTGAAQIVLRFSSDGKTQSITVVENSSIVISSQSVTLTFGRIWVKASGFFSVKTLYWVLGVSGTQFVVEASPSKKRNQVAPPEKSNLSVLEGAVDVSSLKKTSDTQPEVLRVKKSEEVDLVADQPLPKAARPLSQEKINYLLRVIEQVESAASKVEQPLPAPSPSWKTATGAGMVFDVPADFQIMSGTTQGFLSDGLSNQNFELNYLAAANSNKSGFASAGYGDVLISPDFRGTMNDLATISLVQILHTLYIPGVGQVELDLFNAQVGSLKTMDMQVSETTAVSKVNGQQYRVYFALAFRRNAGNAARVVYMVTGFPEANISNTYQTVGKILSSFKQPRLQVGNADSAKEVVNKLVAGDFDGIRASFNEEMKQGLSAAMMRTVWASAIREVGRFRRQDEPRRERQSDFDVYTIRCLMERGVLLVIVSYDKDGRIGGLWVRPF